AFCPDFLYIFQAYQELDAIIADIGFVEIEHLYTLDLFHQISEAIVVKVIQASKVELVIVFLHLRCHLSIAVLEFFKKLCLSSFCHSKLRGAEMDRRWSE